MPDAARRNPSADSRWNRPCGPSRAIRTLCASRRDVPVHPPVASRTIDLCANTPTVCVANVRQAVQRLYDVSGGRILIDGQDITLRSQIAIVQQNPILFHRSLAENIAYGRPGASMIAIEQAAR
jgi:energy-coupling factor transporter ATP-binding protein EcfA2